MNQVIKEHTSTVWKTLLATWPIIVFVLGLVWYSSELHSEVKVNDAKIEELKEWAKEQGIKYEKIEDLLREQATLNGDVKASQRIILLQLNELLTLIKERD